MRSNPVEWIKEILHRFRDTNSELEESNSANQGSSFKTCPSCEKTYFGAELSVCPECDGPLKSDRPDRDHSS